MRHIELRILLVRSWQKKSGGRIAPKKDIWAKSKCTDNSNSELYLHDYTTALQKRRKHNNCSY